jgi:ABC-type antimicrobial peptide transport system permease subunit
MILKNLARRKIRTLLTMLGVSFGVAAIIGLGALAGGLEDGYGSMLSGSKSDMVLSQPDAFDITYSSIDESINKQLEAMPEVEEVSGFLQGFVQTEAAPFFFIFGYPVDSFVLGRFQVISGFPLDSREAHLERGRVLMLGSAAAEALDKTTGDTLRLGNSVYHVIGVYQTGEAFEDGGAVLRLEDAQDLLGKPRQVSLFYIQLEEINLKARFEKRIERQFSDLELSSTGEYADKQMLGDMLDGYVWVIAGLAIVIGGTGMMNAQLMSVFERTREIGVLRSLGWSSFRILMMTLGETLVVCFAGGVVGIIVGWSILAGFSDILRLFGTAAKIRPDLILRAFIVVMTLGLVGGLYPAWRAARLHPIEALRYEGGSSGSQVHRLPAGGMALQSLWQRTTRTLLTLFAIGITVGAIMALEAVVNGTASSMTNMAEGSNLEIMVRQADVADTSLSAIDERIGEKIAAMPQIDSVSGIVFTAVLLPDSQGFFIVLGYAPNEYAIRRFNVVDGKRITSNHQVMLGRVMSESMKKKPGDTIEIGGTRFRVVGIYESGTSWEEIGGVVTLRDSQALAGRLRKVTMFGVKVRDPVQASTIVEKINSQMPDVHAALSGEFVEQMPDMQNANGMLDGISLLAIMVGGVGVLNTMLMAVFERTREIGVLRALGWRRLSILGLILQEALYLGVMGGLTGIAIAFSLVYLSRSIPMIGEAFQPVFTVEVFVRAILVALLLGLIGGLYPAYRATRLQPVEALHYE